MRPQEAVSSIGETTKMLFVDNRSIMEELQLHTQQTEKLKVRKKQLEEDNKRLLREVELLEERVEEYAKQQQQRKDQVGEDSDMDSNVNCRSRS